MRSSHAPEPRTAKLSEPTLYWKLGLFLVTGFVCIVLALGLFGSRMLGQTTVDYKTYFDESVGALGVGSPVRLRGITIGRVKRIGLAPDKRHVEVTCALAAAELRELGLEKGDRRAPGLALQPDMRAQLAQEGLTGPQVLSIDYFDPVMHPPPKLPFPVPERTIPSTRSTLASLEDSLTSALARLPELIDRASRLLASGSDIVTEISEAHLGDRTSEAFRSVGELVALLRSELAQIRAERLPEHIGQAIGSLDSALSQLDQLLSKVDGERGLATSAQRATDAVGDAARGARDVGHQLGATLQEVRQTAATVRRLADTLDRNPDMLVKGRSNGEP